MLSVSRPRRLGELGVELGDIALTEKGVGLLERRPTRRKCGAAANPAWHRHNRRPQELRLAGISKEMASAIAAERAQQAFALETSRSARMTVRADSSSTSGSFKPDR